MTVNKILFLILIALCLCLATSNIVQVDYKSANKNSKKYDQVPQNELIFSKYQALEPLYFYEGKIKGYGFFEPNMNSFIMKLRENGISVYVDYFTNAKAVFYQRDKSYDICRPIQRRFGIYREMYKNNVTNKFKNENKFINYSIPYSLADQFGIFAVQSNKVKYIEKHKFPGTNIYNIKSLLDDESLYTIQIKDMVSGIKKYIYLDPETALRRNPKYSKDRVYEFVASTSEQIPLMLRGKRMDWVSLAA